MLETVGDVNGRFPIRVSRAIILIIGIDKTGRNRAGSHPHHIVAVIQTGEQVVTIIVGDSGRQEVAFPIVQFHRYAGDAQFARVLRAVAVRVIPNAVADSAGIVHTELEALRLHAILTRLGEEGKAGGRRRCA
jgi:hypothetical protein